MTFVRGLFLHSSILFPVSVAVFSTHSESLFSETAAKKLFFALCLISVFMTAPRTDI